MHLPLVPIECLISVIQLHCKINSTTTTVLNLVFTSTGSERTHEKVRAGGLE